MPSGLIDRKDNSDAILSAIVSGIKKLPGNAVGAPIDLASTIVNLIQAGGGYAASKAGLIAPDKLPELSDNPIGGSKWINNKFKLGESQGFADELTQFVGGMVNPSTAAFKAATIGKAIILPALMVHDASIVNASKKLIDAGRADEVYKITKIFEDPSVPGQLKVNVPDTNVVLKDVGGITVNPTTRDIGVSDLASRYDHVIDVPNVNKYVPSINEVPIIGDPNRGGGHRRVVPGTTLEERFRFGSYPTEDQFTQMVMHETQHAVQYREGFTSGSSPSYFLRDEATARKAQQLAGNATTGNPVHKRALDAMFDKAYEHYSNTGGEIESNIVQQQFKNQNWDISPAKLMLDQVGGDKTKIITEPKKIPKVDDDPAIKAIIDFYTIPTSP